VTKVTKSLAVIRSCGLAINQISIEFLNPYRS